MQRIIADAGRSGRARYLPNLPVFVTTDQELCYTNRNFIRHRLAFAARQPLLSGYVRRREKTPLTRRRSRGRPTAIHAEPQFLWRRIDLHLHTPGSGDYQEPRVSYLELLQRAEARGLDIIAFTDHNSVAGYAAMRQEISQLEFLETSGRLLPDEARRLQEYHRLTERVLVLPGFEFTATFGFHILGIFPPETSVRKVEHTLLQLNIPEEKLDQGASEVGATTDVLRAYEIIAGAGGLVIGAHVNSTHGIAMIGLGFGGQTKIAYTQDPNLHALEVTDLESTSRRATSRFFNGSKPEYPRRMHCIQGSDAHRLVRDPLRPEKNLGVGDRATEVFLPEVSFAALQALFSSTDFGRTRPARAPEEHPFDPLTAAREEGATIVQAFQDVPGPPRIRVKAILRDITAFANTNGGVIYVGANADPQEAIRGVEGATELTELIRSESERQIVPPVTPDVETLTSDGKTVLVVTVPKGTETPYALEPGYIYVRQEGETALALRDEIVQLVRSATQEPQPLGIEPVIALPGQGMERSLSWERAVPEVPAAPSVPTDDLVSEGWLPAPRDPQQVAVQQATAAERERQQEPTPVPRTGVEIIASTERNGLIYHTVRDLRNRRVVRNVTRESARRLWRYAILQVEEHVIEPDEIRWDDGDRRFGFWKGYRQAEGMCRYNLIYRELGNQRAQGNGGERLRIFFGVTEEGIDERWRAVLPLDSALPTIQYDEDLQIAGPTSINTAEPNQEQPSNGEVAPLAEGPTNEALSMPPGIAEVQPMPVATTVPQETTDRDHSDAVPEESPTGEIPPRRRSRNRRRKPADSAELESATNAEAPNANLSEVLQAPSANTDQVRPDAAPVAEITPSLPVVQDAPPAPRRRAPRQKPAVKVTDEVAPVVEATVVQSGPDTELPLAPAIDEPPPAKPKRRRAPRKAPTPEGQDPKAD